MDHFCPKRTKTPKEYIYIYIYYHGAGKTLQIATVFSGTGNNNKKFKNKIQCNRHKLKFQNDKYKK